jgi:mono/diheme cytochrome c family protein
VSVKTLLRAVVLLVVAGVVVAGIAVWFVQRHGLSARAEPTALETAVALRLRHLSIPADQRDRKNPLPPTADNLKEGTEHFADHCAVCHANTGAGDTPFGRGLYPHPPILREARTQSLSDGELFSIIDNGIRFTGMPAFGADGDHDAEDTWRLVQFIRHLPQQTKAEIAAMEKLNPKAPAEEPAEEKRGATPGTPAPPHTHTHPHTQPGRGRAGS